jgi:hypothetical protein
MEDGGYTNASIYFSMENCDNYGLRHSNSLGNANEADNSYIVQAGQYNMQVREGTITTSPRFLVMNEVGDSTMTPATVTALTSLTNFNGLEWRASDANGLFMAASDFSDHTTGDVTVPDAGTYTAVWADLGTAARTFTSTGSCATFTNQQDNDTDGIFTPDSNSHSLSMTIVTTGANCALHVN